MTDVREYLTVEETAVMLGVPERTVRRWVGTGGLPSLATPDGPRIALRDAQDLLGAVAHVRPDQPFSSEQLALLADVFTAS